ncbi:poly(ADP-ribose) glycohydrolase isoform X2 [Aethina tumida]|nr:poly(ADP-ribose) glycohydrolase isoform X2 [Aethina tumida]
MVQYPGVNFSQLFSADSTFSSEKIKCILHYFKRVTKNNPIGVVTFERKFIPRNNMPRWDYLDNNLGNTRVHIDSEGTIEDNGLGLLQVDFANKNIGGGVLGYGCVQEEIRFIICPELIISRLFVEQMGDQEAVVITGAERYSDYTGYAETFTFAGDHCDGTPHDDYGRRRTTLVAIDATHFGRPRDQFYPSAMLREVNKAFVGFGAREKEKENAAPVASGNWGCGAFRGDARLKALLQLMAVCAAGRDLVYYSFGDEEIKEDFYKMYLFLANNRITIKQLWRFLSKFSSSSLSSEKLYSFIQQSYFDSKNQPSIRKFLGCIAKPPKDMPSTSSSTSSIAPVQEAKQLDELDSCDAVIDMEGVETVDCDIQEDIIPETPPEEYVPKSRKVSLKSTKEEIAKKIPKNHDEIVSLLGLIDGNANKPKNRVVQDVTFLSELDKFRVNCKTRSVEMINCPNVTMDVEEDVTDDVILEKPQKRKITDYFSKHSKS